MELQGETVIGLGKLVGRPRSSIEKDLDLLRSFSSAFWHPVKVYRI